MGSKGGGEWTPPTIHNLAVRRGDIGYKIGHGDLDVADITAKRNFTADPIQTDELSFALDIMIGATMAEMDRRPDLIKMKSLVFAAADEIRRRIISKLEYTHAEP